MKKGLVFIAVALATAVIAYLLVRPSDDEVYSTLKARHREFVAQDSPARDKRFVDLVLAFREYSERQPNLTRSAAVTWLGDPDDEWPNADHPNDVALVYFYSCTGSDRCAFFIQWDKANDQITEVMPATFTGETKERLPNKAL